MADKDKTTTLIGERYLTTVEVAHRTGTSPSFWEKRRCAGTGPKYRKCGRLVRYYWPDVVEFMEARKRRSTSDGAQPKQAGGGGRDDTA